MGDWGLKVSKPGVNITSNDPRDLLMSSKYQMFKYHGVYDTSVTFSPGEIVKTAEITHGLGYVPAFIPYVYDDSRTKLYIIPSYPYGVDYPISVSAWADTDKVYFKYDIHGYLGVAAGWNVKEYESGEWWNDTYYQLVLGKVGGDAQNNAVRFTNVDISSGDSIASATLKIYISAKNGEGSARRVKFKTYGIDEDNTSALDGGSLGRTKTTAYDTQDLDINNGAVGTYLSIPVTDQLNEIRARAGWSSGNAMGFITNDNGSEADTRYDTYVGDTNILRVLYSGDLTVNFRVIVFKDKIHD